MPRKKKEKKIYVLDTSVILFDHQSLLNFEENDIAIPITVLEELDNFKRGNDTKNFEARQFIRLVDKLSQENSLLNWIVLPRPALGKFKVILNQTNLKIDTQSIFEDRKNDHKIINAALLVKQEQPEAKVTLVTKDINLRLKANALNLNAEDYKTGKIKDVKTLFTGIQKIENVDSEDIKELYSKGVLKKLKEIENPINNHFYILKNGSSSSLAYFNPKDKQLERVEKNYIYGIKPKNAEQTFAINALMNDEIKLVTIQGVAGTGKTLLSLAAALEQKNRYHQIILARPIIPLSNRDIGFLPGDAEEKISPYMEPLWDNLKFIKSLYKQNEKKFKALESMVEEEKILITPLAFIRGRSFSNIIFIIDEAQNLTPHEIKTIVTRAGENTKIIFTGDVHQIDTPYLDEQSNGLSYLIDKMKGQGIFAHVTLQRGERSELANLANDLL